MNQVVDKDQKTARPADAMPTDRSIVFCDKAPAPIGTYSQAVKVGNMIFLAAQSPLVPGSNEFAEGGFEGQVRQTFVNLRAMAEGCGGTMADVVQVTVYITDLSKFAVMNGVMAEFFSQPYPARTTVGAASLPRNAMIAIDGIMVLGADTGSRSGV
jgi:reactive intermediate/imine deaminase